jgi:hypothetical protein
MKRLLGIALLGIVGHFSYSQSGNAKFVASTVSNDRMSLVRNSVDIPSWHEKSFWPIYEAYLSQGESVSNKTYRSLEKISKIDKTSSFEESLNDPKQFFEIRNEQLAIRKEYYQQIANALNGIISFQFLQTELLLDMMESSQIYEGSRWSKYKFHPNALSEDQIKTAKRNTMTAALELSKEEAQFFWAIYDQYEEECDAFLGKDYSVISLYAGEPSDFTPALAKRLGTDLITLLERESKLKEDYFYKFRNSLGPNVAARFLAWEDYYSIISKMYAWADAP